jgi:hypothetical protein
MQRQFILKLRSWTLGTGLLSLMLLPGCLPRFHCLCVDNCSVTPKGALPAPAGTSMTAAIEIQRANAAEDDFVIYKHEWCIDTVKLGPYGQYHLTMIVRWLPNVPFPVIIQPCGDPALDEARRQTIVQHLLTAGFADAPNRVIVDFPKAGGLYGEEAEWIYQEMIDPDQESYGVYGFGRRGGLYGAGGFGFGAGYLTGTAAGRAGYRGGRVYR